MKDFLEFCKSKNLVDIQDDGTISWNENATKSCPSMKVSGGRDGRKDLSSDYVDPIHKMGVVWPFKLVNNKSKK